jgi:hypothetical protein
MLAVLFQWLATIRQADRILIHRAATTLHGGDATAVSRAPDDRLDTVVARRNAA